MACVYNVPMPTTITQPIRDKSPLVPKQWSRFVSVLSVSRPDVLGRADDHFIVIYGDVKSDVLTAQGTFTTTLPSLLTYMQVTHGPL